MAIVVGAGETQFRKRVQAATNRRAREAGRRAHLRDREMVTSLRECLDHGETPRERRHEIRIAGKDIEIGS